MSAQSIFTFQTAQQIRFGRGSAEAAAGIVAGRSRTVLVVHGKTPDRAEWLHRALADMGVQVTTFSCPREPDVALIEAGVAVAKAAGVEAVVSLGGGAVIDAGKAIAALVPARGSMFDYLEVVGKGLPLTVEPLFFVALPTTAGTGAEVTKNAVIGVPEHRRKVSLRDPHMLPDIAIVDPALTDYAPKSVTIASGLDAVTQVIEPYVSVKANRMTDALCRDAIPLGLAALKHLAEEEFPGARDDLAWVSLCGGLALANAGLGAVHGLAVVIGGLAPAPHGAVCGVLLPHVLAANGKLAVAGSLAAGRIREVEGWIADCFGSSPGQATAALARWSRGHGLPGLAEMGVSPGEFAAIAQASGASSSMKGNPVELSVRDLVAVLEAAL